MIAWKTAARMSWELATCPECDSFPQEKISVTEGKGCGSRGQKQKAQSSEASAVLAKGVQVGEQLNAGKKGMGFGKEKHICLILP